MERPPEYSETVRKLLFISQHHTEQTTKWMATQLGVKASWVEAQIPLLRKLGLITTRKRPPKADAVKILKEMASSQKAEITLPISKKPAGEKIDKGDLPEKPAAEKGVPPGWILTSMVIKKERIAAIADVAWYKRCHKRQIQDEAFAEYFERHQDELRKARQERSSG